MEAAVTLAAHEPALLARASVHGRIRLRIKGSSVTGSPSFTIDSIQGSIDGTNYVTIQSFAPISVTGAGELAGVEITPPLSADFQKLKLLATVSQLSGSHKLTVLATLELET